MGSPWAVLGPPWDHLGAILAHLGATLGHLGASLAPLWAILAPSWAVTCPSLPIMGHLGPILGQSWGYSGPFFADSGPPKTLISIKFIKIVAIGPSTPSTSTILPHLIFVLDPLGAILGHLWVIDPQGSWAHTSCPQSAFKLRAGGNRGEWQAQSCKLQAFLAQPHHCPPSPRSLRSPFWPRRGTRSAYNPAARRSRCRYRANLNQGTLKSSLPGGHYPPRPDYASTPYRSPKSSKNDGCPYVFAHFRS